MIYCIKVIQKNFFLSAAIWLNHSNDIDEIGQELKAKLRISESIPCVFEYHNNKSK